MPLDIQIVSDLHTEYWTEKKKFGFFTPAAPILGLLGDIGCYCGTDNWTSFKTIIDEIKQLYKYIILVPGNHEYYNENTKLSMQEIDKGLKNYFATINNFYYLNNASINITEGKTTYTIVGSTLWSFIPEDKHKLIKNSMNDYSSIFIESSSMVRKIVPADTSNLFKKNYAFIKSKINQATKRGNKVIIFTHHKPYIKYDDGYINDNKIMSNIFNAYMSDCTELIKPPVVFWGYGHCHIKDDRLINGVRLYSNCKGYPRQRTNFNPCEKITIK